MLSEFCTWSFYYSSEFNHAILLLALYGRRQAGRKPKCSRLQSSLRPSIVAERGKLVVPLHNKLLSLWESRNSEVFIRSGTRLALWYYLTLATRIMGCDVNVLV